jgi:hypothetical protein
MPLLILIMKVMRTELKKKCKARTWEDSKSILSIAKNLINSMELLENLRIEIGIEIKIEIEVEIEIVTEVEMMIRDATTVIEKDILPETVNLEEDLEKEEIGEDLDLLEEEIDHRGETDLQEGLAIETILESIEEEEDMIEIEEMIVVTEIGITTGTVITVETEIMIEEIEEDLDPADLTHLSEKILDINLEILEIKAETKILKKTQEATTQDTNLADVVDPLRSRKKIDILIKTKKIMVLTQKRRKEMVTLSPREKMNKKVNQE